MCSTERRKSNGFGMIQGWINNDSIVIFVWTVKSMSFCKIFLCSTEEKNYVLKDVRVNKCCQNSHFGQTIPFNEAFEMLNLYQKCYPSIKSHASLGVEWMSGCYFAKVQGMLCCVALSVFPGEWIISSGLLLKSGIRFITPSYCSWWSYPTNQ